MKPPTMKTTTFADNLKKLRRKAGLSQAALSIAAGLNPVMVYRYESGRETPRLLNAEKLAKALGVEVPQLLEKE